MTTSSSQSVLSNSNEDEIIKNKNAQIRNKNGNIYLINLRISTSSNNDSHNNNIDLTQSNVLSIYQLKIMILRQYPLLTVNHNNDTIEVRNKNNWK